MFISITVFLSFGFRGCDDAFCDFVHIVSNAAWGESVYYTIGEKIYGLSSSECISSLNHTSVSSLNDIDWSNISTNDGLGGFFCAVGNSGSVIWSPDGGETWEDRSILGVTTNFKSFDFLDYGSGDLQVVVCGEGGTVYKSTNSGGGWTWQQVNTITNRNLTSIIAMTTDLYIAVGDSGTVIRTSDGGQTWENKSVAQNKYFNRIFSGMPVSAFGYAWAVGNNAYILATTDYGNSWFPQYPLTFDTSMVHIYDIAFRNQNDGILVGQGGLVNYTTNGGTTWLQDSEFNGFTNDDIISLAVKDENTATAVVRGTNSDGMATTTLITVSSEPLAVDDNNNIIPSEYSLGQNYPNPFNPSTTIKYTIPNVTLSGDEGSRVQLKIYDVLGNKVATLVDEYKPAGSYEVEFDASVLTSGIYFYKIQAGSFVETKKMILIK
jgi:photosystem II stability/assembly factor-like uncharacterized protein